MKQFVVVVKDAVQGKPVKLRSSKWSGVRKKFVAKHPTCAACGRPNKLEVHHIKPFHLHPELELEFSNLMTLCEHRDTKCHFTQGHLGDWHSFNPDVVVDAATALSMRLSGSQ